MPVISVPTSFNIDVAFEVPSLGRRMGSLALDFVIEICYLLMATYLVGKITVGMNSFNEDDQFNLRAIQLLMMVPIFLYHIIMEITTNGQSFGKKITKLRVVNHNGGKASISQFLIRWLLRVSDLWIIIILFLLLNTMGGNSDTQTVFIFLFGFGFLLTDIILVATSKKGQRVGDILAHTILIKTNTREDLAATIFREVNEQYVPLFPQVMRINDRDLNIIKSLLDAARKTHQYSTLQAPADRVKTYLNIKTDLENYQFLDKLLEDYNYLSTN